MRRPRLLGRERVRPGDGCADFASFARFPVKTLRRRPDRFVRFQFYPFRFPMNPGTDSRPTGEPGFRAATHQGARRAGSERGRMAASQAPRLGIPPKWDVLGGPAVEISQK